MTFAATGAVHIRWFRVVEMEYTIKPVGAGSAVGVTLLDTVDAEPVPMLFVALTLKE